MHEQVHCHDEAPVVHRSSLLHHPNSVREGMLKLNAKFDAHLLLYLLSHFECDGHREHMLTQWCLLSPMTTIVMLSLFTHAYSCPLSLAARLHQCCTSCSHFINYGWTFSEHSKFMCAYMHIHIDTCVWFG